MLSNIFFSSRCGLAAGCAEGHAHTPYLCRSDCGEKIAARSVQGCDYWFQRQGDGSWKPLASGLSETIAELTYQGGLFCLSVARQIWKFLDFDDPSYPGFFNAVNLAGQMVAEVVSYVVDGIGEIQVTRDSAIESHLCTYGPFGLTGITARRSGSWNDFSRVQYTYNATGDVETVTTQLFDGTSWIDTDLQYFRYYTDSAGGTGYAGGLKFLVGYQAYKNLQADGYDPLTASDDVLKNYADEYFEYDADRRVAKHVLDAGSRAYTLSYEDRSDCPGYTPGYNSWEVKTVETRPDGARTSILPTTWVR